jgi:hypothetical protein
VLYNKYWPPWRVNRAGIFMPKLMNPPAGPAPLATEIIQYQKGPDQTLAFATNQNFTVAIKIAFGTFSTGRNVSPATIFTVTGSVFTIP